MNNNENPEDVVKRVVGVHVGFAELMGRIGKKQNEIIEAWTPEDGDEDDLIKELAIVQARMLDEDIMNTILAMGDK